MPAIVTKAVKDFLARDLSPNTKKAFSCDLGKFVEVFGRALVSKIEQHTIVTYLAGLTNRNGEPVSVATYNRHFGTLLNFFRWLEKLKQVGNASLQSRLLRYSNPMAGMERKKLPQRLPRPLSKDQVTTILGRIDSARDKALFTLLYDSGVRIQEALNLGVEDVDFQTDRAWIQGKGGRERHTFLSQRAKHLLKRYLRTLGNPTSGPLFLSRQYSEGEGRRLSYAMAHRLFRKYAEGIVSRGKPATIHQLRHAFGSERAGVVDALALRQLMGHQSLRTTLQYAEVNPEAAQEAFRRYEASRMHS
ncbi:MAG TPA: hypothetical protein DIC52_14685 [Candidatus Latescibacteria bacterium]|nr:hypothetical protein [Candidatus Latescibacterota bacterium]